MHLPDNKGCKLFQDSVHGVMKFHKLLIKCIDTPEFQRLRNIKQLSTAYLVYPAAAHNRFEHSLGVCWLAGELLNELQRNSPDEWKIIFPEEKEGKTAKLALQIGGLLHDVGHGPFSHTWETFVKSYKHDWEHENTSCQLVDLMVYKDVNKSQYTELGEEFKKEFANVEQTVEFIKAIIKGGPGPDKPPKEKAFLFQVVANKYNDIDVDKFDYLMRDSSLLKIGLPFEYKRLISLSRIEIRDGASHITFRDAERFSIQGMFRVRADLHLRAYQHRVAKCLEAMLIDALREANDKGFQIGGLPLAEVHKNPRQFIKLTDSIQEIIYNSEEKTLEKARQILDRLLRRDLYKTVYERVLNVERTPQQIMENKPPSGLSREKLIELERELDNNFAISQVGVNQGKYYDPMKNVLFYKKDGGNISQGETPLIQMDLPFYKVYFFQREHGNYDIAQIQEKVDLFLSNEGFH